jgi:lipoate-protein ligase B
VWVETAAGLAKIAAIGVRISGGVSSHGFALNVAPNLDYFSGIVPCGIQEHGVTSMAVELERPVTIEEVLPHLTAAFQDVFAINPLTTHYSPINQSTHSTNQLSDFS